MCYSEPESDPTSEDVGSIPTPRFNGGLKRGGTIMRQDDQSWQERLAFVGMIAESCRSGVKVARLGGGLVSYGSSIEEAAAGQPIDWYAVDCRVNQIACDLICHL